MMSSTSEDLREHLDDIKDRIDSLANNGPHDDDRNSSEWRDLWAEKRCAQQGLAFCAQISSEIERLEPGVQGTDGEANAPVARQYWKNGVEDTKGSIRAMESRFRSHEREVEQQMQAMPSRQTEVASELEDLHKSRDGLEKCLRVVSQAEEQMNVFERIHLSENSVNFTVSTNGKTVQTRDVTLSGGSFNFGGQVGSAELTTLFQGLGLAGSVANGATFAAQRDAGAAPAGPLRSERSQTMSNVLEQSAEVPRVTAANGKSPRDRDARGREAAVSPGVVMCESGTASSASRTMQSSR